MKRNSIITILLLAMGLGFATSSCEDMLTADLERHQDTPAQDTLYTYWGIIKSLQNLGERYVVLGECRGDLVTGTNYISDSIDHIANFDMDKAIDGSCRYLNARDYYHVINSCNSYLAYADTFRVTGTNQKYMIREYAQVEAIRAWVYLQLVQTYGEVPFYTQALLTTEDIDAFANNPSSARANRENLVDLLGAKLERVKDVALPNYNMYKGIMHSRRAMIPVNLILGDLYLLRGTQADCIKAAACYYEWLDENEAMMSTFDYYTGYRDILSDNAGYMKSVGCYDIFYNPALPSKSDEMITAIPSEKNKLTGRVNRGLCTLFGFETEASVADTSSSAKIYLFPYDQGELTASPAYFNLCKEQAFVARVGDGSELLVAENKRMEGVGDARQAWIIDWISDKDENLRLISKQNPSYQFSTTYPVIYRKTTVWLRFAEAINRAGFPGYAFAILQDGICSNSKWFPSDDLNFEYYEYENFYLAEEITNQDTIFYPTLEEAQLAAEAYMLANKDVKELPLVIGHNPNLDTPTNRPLADNGIICNYISYKEYQDAKTANFLNFDKASFKGGSYLSVTSLARSSSYTPSRTVANSNYSGGLSVGVHSRGCGLLPPGADNEFYNFEDAVMKANPEVTDVYDPAQQDEVIKGVENLIIDELALETAFEGNRFFDLMRVAMRRGEPEFLAEKVAARNGKDHADYVTLYSKLSNPSNWYFKLPNR